MKTEVLRLESLSDDVLLARVDELVKRNRRVEAELIWHLAEVDRRRLYLREACPSMHVYATSRLHLSEAEAYLRITVARVSRRFPIALGMLADGRLHVSAIAKLAPHLREENCQPLLERAVRRSKREIEALVAELAPKPDVRSLIRRLPGSPQASEAAELVLGRVGNQGVASQEHAAGICRLSPRRQRFHLHLGIPRQYRRTRLRRQRRIRPRRRRPQFRRLRFRRYRRVRGQRRGRSWLLSRRHDSGCSSLPLRSCTKRSNRRRPYFDIRCRMAISGSSSIER